MNLTTLDLVVFVGFLAVVIAVSLWAGRRERSAEDYFLAGRTLPWWLIGFSLIASNISTEHFVGMAGAAYGRVLMGLSVPPAERATFRAYLGTLGYQHWDETDNPAYGIFAGVAEPA